MGWRERRETRRRAEMDRVIAALRAHPGESAIRVARCAGVGTARIYVYLAQLEGQDVVASDWAEGPYPRRRRYWLTGRAS